MPPNELPPLPRVPEPTHSSVKPRPSKLVETRSSALGLLPSRPGEEGASASSELGIIEVGISAVPVAPSPASNERAPMAFLSCRFEDSILVNFSEAKSMSARSSALVRKWATRYASSVCESSARAALSVRKVRVNSSISLPLPSSTSKREAISWSLRINAVRSSWIILSVCKHRSLATRSSDGSAVNRLNLSINLSLSWSWALR
mmetsp:Transcript_70084/g.111224  ORF Transcript_70084/g.111224 Transcript_70084/m.111224 type:complete len:204 (-) Transcript_70084:927-1538(-)